MTGAQVQDADVIVVGGGFTGVTAARELCRTGRSVTLLEGRDRLAGRTWTAERLGFNIELGGTWVHWLQPHVWAELTRYGIGLKRSPEPAKVGYVGAGDVEWLTPDEFFARLEPGQRAFQEDVLEVLPTPFSPFAQEERIAALDGQSVADRLKSLGLSDEDYLLNHVMWSQHFNFSADDGALTQALRWTALGVWDWLQLLDACAQYKPLGGMSNLVQKIADDAQADIHLETVVKAIEQDDDGVVVTATDGRQFRAKAAIVTVPINTLNDIEFTPQLSEAKRAFADERHVAAGFKVWIRVKGKYDPMFCLAAPEASPLSLIQAEFWDGDDATLFVAFGLEDGALDVKDVGAVQAAIRKWLPDAEVEAVADHAWTADPLAKGTWAMLKPGQLTKYMRDAQQREGRVKVAGSDIADGWGGFVDGAIESGMRAAQEIDELLG